MPPLARIVTQHPEAAEPIAARLRALGYVVEIVSPEESVSGRAAVEVRVDETTLDQAIAYAKSFVQTGGNVFVDTRAVTHAEFPREPAVEEVELEPESQFSQLAANLILNAATSMRQKHAVLKTAVRRTYERWQLRMAEQTRDRQERAEQKRLQQMERARLAREAVERDRKAQLERERLAQLESVRRQAQLEAERARIAELESARRQAKEAERLEAERLRDAQIAEQQRSIAEQRIPSTTAPATPVSTPSAVPVSAESGRRLRSRAQFKSVVGLRQLRAHSNVREWGTAAVAAAITTIVLLMAWSAISHPRPASPLSNRDLMQMRQVQQQVPFGAVTLKPAAPPPAHIPMAETSGKPPKAAHKPSPVRARGNSGQSYDDAVVIRHFAPKAPVSKRQDTASIKRFSDMN